MVCLSFALLCIGLYMALAYILSCFVLCFALAYIWHWLIYCPVLSFALLWHIYIGLFGFVGSNYVESDKSPHFFRFCLYMVCLSFALRFVIYAVDYLRFALVGWLYCFIWSIYIYGLLCPYCSFYSLLPLLCLLPIFI